MESFALLKQVFAYFTIIVGLAGCFLLHLRQRSGPSLVFLMSVILLSTWLTLINLLSGAALNGAAILGLDLMHQANDIVVSLLSLLAAISFAIAMHRVVRPNNSFKPKPLRGSA
jgi:hypothetical protein